MSAEQITCWTLVQGAAQGQDEEREKFTWRYAPLVQTYLHARWNRGALSDQIDDTVQEVFLECFRQGGALSRLDQGRPGGFRAFLYGVSRNVALRVERRSARSREQQAPTSDLIPQQEIDEDGISRVFDRAWARQLMSEAADLQRDRARALGADALQRVQILELRFGEGIPIRDIARRLEGKPANIHHEYALARKEFRVALLDIVSFHLPGSPKEVEAECARLHLVLA